MRSMSLLSQRTYLPLILGFSTFLASHVQAGTTSSGGAEFIGDGHNPWFIENTKEVTYCIVHDPNTFHLPTSAGTDFLSSKVRLTLDFWRREFSYTVAPKENYYKQTFKIATQQFTEVSCDLNPDIRFQFGVLSQPQADLLGSPQRYLAANLRTSYDTETFKGKGFVYLSADTGPLAPKDANIVPMPWALGNGELVGKVLLHELGHVFGLGHENNLGNTYYDQVMGEEYVQWMFHPFNVGAFASYDFSNFHFFSYSARGGTRFNFNNRIPGDFSKLITYFGGQKPIDFVYFDFSNPPLLKVMGAFDGPEGRSSVELGSAAMALSDLLSDTKEITSLWVSKGNNMFPCSQVVCVVHGPSILQEEWRGTFHSNQGNITHQLTLQRSPDAEYKYGKFRVGGAGNNGEIYLDLFRELWVPDRHY